MALAIPDVSFPLHGQGATVAVRDRLPLRLIELSGTTIDRGWSAHDLTAPTWRLYLNLDDGAEGRVHGHSAATPFAAGHLYVIPAWLRWSSRCRGPVRHFNAMLDLPSLARERVTTVCDRIVRLAGPDNPLGRNWLACAVAHSRARNTAPNMVARGHAAVWAALAAYFDTLGESAARLADPDPDERFARLRAWVEERLDQPLPRAALAQAAGCSEAELARRFAAGLGTSPVRWLRDRRIARAAELLRTTDLSIEEIATACGLGDRSRFSKVFAHAIGSGPAAYRRQRRTPIG